MTFPRRVGCGLCLCVEFSGKLVEASGHGLELSSQPQVRDGKDSHVKDLLFPTSSFCYDMESRLVTSVGLGCNAKNFAHADFLYVIKNPEQKTCHKTPHADKLLASHACSYHAAPLRTRCTNGNPRVKKMRGGKSKTGG